MGPWVAGQTGAAPGRIKTMPPHLGLTIPVRGAFTARLSSKRGAHETRHRQGGCQRLPITVVWILGCTLDNARRTHLLSFLVAQDLAAGRFSFAALSVHLVLETRHQAWPRVWVRGGDSAMPCCSCPLRDHIFLAREDT